MRGPVARFDESTAEVARLEKLASDFRYVDQGLSRAYAEKAAEVRDAAQSDLEKVAGATGPAPLVAQMRDVIEKSVGTVSAQVRQVQRDILDRIEGPGRPIGLPAAPRPDGRVSTTKSVPTSRPAPLHELSGEARAQRLEEMAEKAATPIGARELRAMAREARLGATR